jgi:hypothetical protein
MERRQDDTNGRRSVTINKWLAGAAMLGMAALPGIAASASTPLAASNGDIVIGSTASNGEDVIDTNATNGIIRVGGLATTGDIRIGSGGNATNGEIHVGGLTANGSGSASQQAELITGSASDADPDPGPPDTPTVRG